jgi:hypothetical protein
MVRHHRSRGFCQRPVAAVLGSCVGLCSHGGFGTAASLSVFPRRAQGAAFPGTLGELVARLKAWRATLQATVEAATPGPLRLEQLSRKLQVPVAAASAQCCAVACQCCAPAADQWGMVAVPCRHV